MYAIMGEDASQNIFGTLTAAQWTAARKTVVATVLATDMVHHFAMVTEVDIFLELNEGALQRRSSRAEVFDQSEKKTRFLLNLFMHAADISNPAKVLSPSLSLFFSLSFFMQFPLKLHAMMLLP